ncbi:class F sortase [Streptomyces sp. CBMA29]|uniref:class F sortase n=1 Tax=Streptomyces sp. CBMA29 TaxID=1896314 RepID=UPI002948B87B|nr:class F sortase [Streptomyces sp. CBMA29]
MDHNAPAGSGLLRRIALTVLTTVAVSVGITLISNGAQSQTPPPQPGAAQAFAARDDTPNPTPTRPGVPAITVLPPSAPTKVRIPSIHLDAPVTGLDLQQDGHLAAPPDDDRNLAGWYRGGTAPGAVGTAILAGHVDTQQGSAVFYDLGALKKGAAVEVDRQDGRTALFTIDAIEVYAAKDFPNNKVYGPASRPELRLITCGGGFDKKRQQYLGNVVVYAHLTGARL